jgi:hypothetical protein
VANNNGVLTYIVVDNVFGSSRALTFDTNGNLMGNTSVYNDLFGTGYLKGKVYVTQKTNNNILTFGFNGTTQTIIEPPEKTVSWGIQPMHISIINNFIYVASSGTGLTGKFDVNLTTPPVTYNCPNGPAGFTTNYNSTFGWSTVGDNSGRVDRIDLVTGQTTQWSNPVGQYAWQVACFQNTLFFTARNPQGLEWYKQDGAPLGSVSTAGYNPTGICIYNNPNTGKTEAAVSFWEGQIWIYTVEQI